MRFNQNDIQNEIDKIQSKSDTPDFLLVTCPSSYYQGADGDIWDEEEETNFFTPESNTYQGLLIEIAHAIINQSL